MSSTSTSSQDNDLLRQLADEHAALKQRVRELGNQPTMTESEKVEYQLLKKRKLRTKDRIRMLEAF